MELDDLKKTWNLIDEQLKDKELIREEDISRLITKAGSGIAGLSRLLVRGIIAAVIILGIVSAIMLMDQHFDWFFTILLIVAVPALAWDLFTVRYLSQTKMDGMPLVEVIGRINRYYRWVIIEEVVAMLLVLTMAVLFFIDRGIWHLSTVSVLFFFGLWAVAIGMLYWIYQKKAIHHIREIRKNLNELKELQEGA